MPSSISQRVVDNLFSALSALPPKLLKVHFKGRRTSSRSKTAEPQRSPIRLPSDVLQLVFSEAMQQSCSDIDLSEKAQLRSTILACSQVCQLWRHAARGYSPLWVHAVDFQSHSLEVIKDLLQLSAPHGIDVGHRSAPFYITQARDVLVLNLLKRECYRVQEWNIQMLESDYALEDCPWISGVPDLRQVQTLRLKGSVVSPSGTSLVSTPSLRKLCLTETNLKLSPCMDLSHLTELSVSCATSPSAKRRLADWLALLRGMPRLQFLSLKEAVEPGPERHPFAAPQPIEPVVLSQLRLLSVVESNWASASQFFALLATPAFQKPADCGLDLTLPSATSLDNGFAFHNAMGLLGAISMVQLPPQPATVASPRLEMQLKAYQSGFQFSLGTVPDHEKTLYWNGERGTQGVHDYLNDYFKTPIFASSPSSLHPPLSVTVRNPTPQDIINVCIPNNHLFSAATSLRITVEPQLCQLKDIYPILETIPGVMARMREVETVTMDEGALVAVLPNLQGHLCLGGEAPVPVLPNLQYLAIESTMMEIDEVGWYHDLSGTATRSIVSQYTKWRMTVGRPVYAFGCAAMGGPEDRNSRNGSWKRRGIVPISL